MLSTRSIHIYKAARYFCSEKTPIVAIKEGKVRGSIETLCDGAPYYSFKGIPYAEPPIGNKRFKAPEPQQPWLGIHDATKHGPVCPQFNLLARTMIEGNENCLFLNVYTKSLQTSSKLPVMVHLHFGAYRWGSGDSDIHGPEPLISHDVVLVTLNYRLQLFGFLCMDTEEYPGNAGMKDQVLALKWVQNNIAHFGGDPNNVTLFGGSAGGSAVTLHIISPMSKGLFHKAIAGSGNCLMDWAVSTNPRERAFRAGKVLGIDTKDANELMVFLKTIPALKLAGKIGNKIMTREENLRDMPIMFGPVVEKKFDKVEAFLNEDIINLLEENKMNNVPLITGYNSAEGIISINSIFKILNVLNKEPFWTVRREISKQVNKTKLKEFGERIKKQYSQQGKDWTENDYESICNLAGDMHFTYNTYRFADLYAKSCDKLYMYKMDYDSDANVVKKSFGWPQIRGMSHGEDAFYLFLSNSTRSIYNEQEKVRKMIYDLTKMWSNFAYSSCPTPDDSLGVIWKPYTKQGRELIHIQNEKLEMWKFEDLTEKDRMVFWNQIYEEAGLPCMQLALN